MNQNLFTGVKVFAARLLCCFSCCALGLLFANDAMAQEETKPDQVQNSERDELALDQQKQLVKTIYEATKTTKTVKDYTAFLAQCDEALAKKLSSENREYVNSLIGWALNRRGEKHFELAVELKRIGNLQHVEVARQALEDFNQSVIADPSRYRTWMSRGIAHAESGNYDLAIADFTQVIKLKPDEANGWFNRAEALYQRSNPVNFPDATSADKKTGERSTEENLKVQKLGYQQAIADYDVVLRLKSNDPQALTGRGHAKFALGQFNEALVDYEQVTKLAPGNATAYINRGDAYQKLGKWESAQSDFEKALSMEKTGVTHQRVAWFKATCPDESFRDASEAIRLINLAIERDGDTATNLDTLAAAQAAAGNFEVAKSTQQKVIGLVSAEVVPEAKQYQARLALYEKGEPYTEDIQEPEPSSEIDQ